MRLNRCDRCKRVEGEGAVAGTSVGTSVGFSLEPQGTGSCANGLNGTPIDLCDECRRAFLEWLKEVTP